MREEFLSRLCDRCTCDRRLGSGGEQACAEFFEELDDAGKALFMLGGPVDGRCPEEGIDACAREFVRKAWIVRCSTLEKQSECPLVTDLTGRESENGRRGTIESFFRPSSRAHCAKSCTIGLQGGTLARQPTHAHITRTRSRTHTAHSTSTSTRTAHSTRARTHTRTRTCIAQSTIGPAGRLVRGSGLNASEYVMRSD